MMEEFTEGGLEGTRRAILQAAAGLLGAGAVGTASGRPDSPIRGAGVPYGLDDSMFHRADAVGYHSLGDIGSADRSGHASQRNDFDRNMAVDVHGDLAAVSFLQSGEADAGRRVGAVPAPASFANSPV